MAIARKVEHTLVMYILKEGIKIGAKSVDMWVTKTTRNTQLLEMLKELSFKEVVNSKIKNSLFSFHPGSFIQSIDYPEWFKMNVDPISWVNKSIEG